MTFIVITIDHGWQSVPSGHETQEVATAKATLGRVIREVAQRAQIDLICEECDPRLLSIAQRFAYEHIPRIPWKNIFMTAQERQEAGICEALQNRPSDTIQEGEGLLRTVDIRIPEDDVREQFFANECIMEAERVGANTILVLCGDMHVDSLAEKLRARGHQAITNHDRIPRRYWR